MRHTDCSLSSAENVTIVPSFCCPCWAILPIEADGDRSYRELLGEATWR